MTRIRPATAGAALLGLVLLGQMMAGCSSTRTDAVPQRDYAFWPVAPAEPRVQFVRSLRSSRDVASSGGGAFSRLVFGPETEEAVAIQKPYGLTMRGGRIYVCDSRNNAVTVLDLPKKEARLIGVTGFNRLSNPVDVAIADDGMIYVADNQRGGVLVFDQRERFARAIGHDTFRPVGVAVHGDRLYACNLQDQVVDIFDRHSGERLGVIGSVGDADGQFRVPLGIDVDRHGDVYVMDMMRCRLQKFSPDGELIGAVGAMGDVAGSFARPKQVAVDSEGLVYVVDAAFQNVQMFNDRFELLMSFGAGGDFPGSMNLPAGICIAETPEDLKQVTDDTHPGFKPQRLILVTNQFGPNRVAVYAIGERREGWSVAQLSASSAVSSGAGANPEAERLQIPVEGLDPEEQPEPAELQRPDDRADGAALRH